MLKVSRENFETILKKGKNIYSPLLSFKYVVLSKEEMLPSCFSFVVSGKIAKKAIERNLFKRRGRHIVRKLKDKINPGFMGAFFAKEGANKVSFADLEKEIISLLNVAKVLL
ncbi:MAG: Ribonuclease P protein component [Parcubacteria group bacterium GW2011_GWF2_38_76]|nr:MAG: Ribonuclease P protein component [Parcubacteria group bacterium GW2011_GWF2_38_76]HBM46152.1 ribonuclease P protein component [Patescibacteria group bacterium]